MKQLISLLAAALLSGCASTATKGALDQMTKTDLAYGEVVDVYEADSSSIRRICDTLKNDKDSQAICANLKGYDIAKTAILRLNRFVTWQVPVPREMQVQKGNFVEFSPSRQMAAFRRIAAKSATTSCKWDGPSTYQFENSAAGVATGFVGGLFVIPTIAAVGSDDALAGGVVCDGWSYKTIISKVTAK